MPKSKLLWQKSKPKEKTTDEQTKRLVNRKYVGDEPVVKIPAMSSLERAQFYTWCSYMVDTRLAREWMDQYLGGFGTRSISDKWINHSLCFQARLINLGVAFSAQELSSFSTRVEEMMAHAQAEPEADDDKRTIADYVREKTSDVIGELEGLIDDGLPPDFSIEAWYREHNASAAVIRKAIAKLMPVMLEIDDAIEQPDDQLREGYAHLNRAQLKALREFYFHLIEDSQRMVDNVKKARVSRKPKAPSVEKRLKFIEESYLKHSKEWNVTSLHPVKIIGAQELWTLNTKYKLLTVFRAESHGGQLDVARCKVTGFDKNNSHTYRLGRGKKGNSIVDAVLKSSKAAAKKVVVGLKTAPLQERVNENTVLLRV